LYKNTVLIVDDSAVVRQSLEEVLSSDLDIEVMATASDRSWLLKDPPRSPT
jgi:two-component system chemotaxis response regulator CheB